MDKEQGAAEGAPEDILLETERLYQESARDLVAAIQVLRTGKSTDVKAAMQAVKDLKAAFQMVMEERTRVDRLRKQTTAGAATGTHDFGQARDEIGRRLALLRSAGGGG